MGPAPEKLVAEQFQFHPRWWWDPIPDIFRHHLSKEVLVSLARVQLEKQLAISRAEVAALEQTMKLMG